MKKSRLFKILFHADRDTVLGFSAKIQETHSVRVVKEPTKTLSMIQMREPVKKSLFYLGEVLVTEAIVRVEEQRGMAVVMGDDFEKTLATAVVDAAFNGNFPEMAEIEKEMLELEKTQTLREEKENALFLGTKVDFHSMDSESP